MQVKVEPILYGELIPGELYSWYPASYWYTRQGNDDMEVKVKGSEMTRDNKYLKDHLEQMGKLSCTRLTFYPGLKEGEIK
jgi:hypothetical protein